jgi:hypothetical protein
MKDPKKTNSDESTPSFSKGGSRMYEYAGGEFDRPTLGIPPEKHFEFQERREKVYEQLFGASESVYHEILPMLPHVDVYIHAPNKDRPFYTLVTGGMSSTEMTLPKGISREYARSELVFYCREPKPEYQELLRKLAHFPHDNSTWLSFGHTMPNGNPPKPIFGNPSLNTFLFMPSIVAPDSELGERLSLDGDPVNLVWVVLISTAECNYKLEHGMDAFYDLLDKHNHPFVFDDGRRSYL